MKQRTSLSVAEDATKPKETWTPGPWPLETVSTQVGICHKIGVFPSRGARRETSACVYDDGATLRYPDPELLANARLMAAAPALYEACQRAFAVENSVTQGQEKELREGYRDMLRATLALVDGPGK